MSKRPSRPRGGMTHAKGLSAFLSRFYKELSLDTRLKGLIGLAHVEAITDLASAIRESTESKREEGDSVE